jgi:hypothetical protein
MYGMRIFSRIMPVSGSSKTLITIDIEAQQVDVSTGGFVGLDMPVDWPRDRLS